MAPVTSHRRQQVALLIGLTALAFNLRPTAVSVGPVLDEIRSGLGMSPATAGVVTTLPVLTFAFFGATAPWFGRRFGMHRVMLAALLLTTVMLVLRSSVDDPALFIVTTIPALAGMAVANVLLPSLVKRHFPHRIGLVTAAYTTALSVGLTFASVLTVPVADGRGSWRWGLALWGLTALVAALPWLGLLRHDVRPESERASTITARQTSRTSLAWAMAVFFGAQSLQAYAVFGWLPQIYRDAGFSAQTAGILLGVATATSIPISFLLPSMAVRRTNQAPLILTLCGFYAVGYLGLIWWPGSRCGGVGAADRDRDGDVPAGADPDRAAGANERRDGRPVGLHAERRLRLVGDRPVPDGDAVRRDRGLDRAARGADRAADPPGGRRACWCHARASSRTSSTSPSPLTPPDVNRLPSS